ncbi:acetone carboxylase gamma subunit [Bradyrhizobium diazoefficiens]
MSPWEPSLEFICPGCGEEISESIKEVPNYDVLADRESDARGYANQA